MDNDPLYWYVLFVQTGREEEIVDELKRIFTDTHFKPFLLKTVHVFRRQGKKSLFQKICFPGYVFIESNKTSDIFTARMFSLAYPIKHIYKVLHYGDNRTDIAIHESERIELSKLFGKEYCADISQGFKENDFVKIISGPLVDQESKILRFNKNRNEAVVRIDMFGKPVEVLVGLNVLQKNNSF